VFAFLAGAAVVAVLVTAALAFALVLRVLFWLVLLPFKLLFWLLAAPFMLVKVAALSLGGVLAVVLGVAAVAIGLAFALIVALPLIPLLLIAFVAWVFLRLMKRPAAA
jgi:hypothetical protein